MLSHLIINLFLGYAHQPHVPHGRLALHRLRPGDLAARSRDVELVKAQKEANHFSN